MANKPINKPVSNIVFNLYILFLIIHLFWIYKFLDQHLESSRGLFSIGPIIVFLTTLAAFLNKKFEFPAFIIVLFIGILGWGFYGFLVWGCWGSFGKSCQESILNAEYLFIGFSIYSVIMILLRNYKRI